MSFVCANSICEVSAYMMIMPVHLRCSLSLCCCSACAGFLDTRTPLAISIIANLVNVVGDYYFINFAMGVAGAAWATTLSQFATAIGLTVALIAKKRLRVEHMFRVPAVPLLQKVSIYYIDTSQNSVSNAATGQHCHC
jgi:Na+-driven multidrug efflux pump